MIDFNLLAYLHFSNLLWVFVLPIAFMGIDILTGLFNSLLKEKNFQSTIMRAGLTKKVGEIAIILVAVICTSALEIPMYLMQAISLYIALMELMSIIENADKMGVPMPKFIKDLVNNINKSIENDSIAELTAKLRRLEAILAENHIEIDDLK